VTASNTSGGNCCDEAEDFYITVTGCTSPTTAPPATWNCVNNSCVQVNDGTGTYSTLSACQAACATTTTTTTTTTAAPSNCYALQLLWSPLTTCEGSQSVYYGDFSNFCTATLLYTDSSCTTLASSGYYTTAFGTQEYRFWDGTQFTTNCANC